MLDNYDIIEDSSKFPINLLSAGYGTAFLGALILYYLNGGIATSSLAFWLGGAVAVFFWGGVWIQFDKIFSHTLRASQ